MCKLKSQHFVLFYLVFFVLCCMVSSRIPLFIIFQKSKGGFEDL